MIISVEVGWVRSSVTLHCPSYVNTQEIWCDLASETMVKWISQKSLKWVTVNVTDYVTGERMVSLSPAVDIPLSQGPSTTTPCSSGVRKSKLLILERPVSFRKAEWRSRRGAVEGVSMARTGQHEGTVQAAEQGAGAKLAVEGKHRGLRQRHSPRRLSQEEGAAQGRQREEQRRGKKW